MYKNEEGSLAKETAWFFAWRWGGKAGEDCCWKIQIAIHDGTHCCELSSGHKQSACSKRNTEMMLFVHPPEAEVFSKKLSFRSQRSIR